MIVCASQLSAAPVKIALEGAPDLEKSGTYVWVHTFGEYLESHGMEVQEFERGSLGDEAEKMDQIQQGLLEVSSSDTKRVSQLAPSLTPLTLPYFVPDFAALDKGLYDGGMIDKINEEAAPHGLRVIGISSLGLPAGIFNTKHAVKSPADLADLRMRALDETDIAIYELWGTRGTIVSWDEVPNALQTGIADGYLNPPIVPILYGHTGFIKHFTDARMSTAHRTIVISEDWYQGLSAEEQQIVDDAAAAATAANREWLAGRASELDQLREAGIEVTTLSPDVWLEFQQLSMPLWQQVPMPEGLLDSWKQAMGN
ncbi:TRAP transporter substrate-binding protein [Paracoccus sp. 12-3]|nr:TRAP transporter substrate-binding protein [Paracoccus xiamenensis]